MESAYARNYGQEPFYVAQEPPPCRLSKEHPIETPYRNGGENESRQAPSDIIIAESRRKRLRLRQQHRQRSSSSGRGSLRRKRTRKLRPTLQPSSSIAPLLLQRQEDELVELRRLLQLARTEITFKLVQNRLERLERPLPTRHAAPGKKAVHPRYGGRPSPETSPVFAPTTPGQPHTAAPTATGTGQPLQTTGMPFQFGPPKPQVPATEQPVTPQQMPLATVPEAPTTAATPEALPVMPQLATHIEKARAPPSASRRLGPC